MKKIVSLVVACTALSGCGFQPMYGTQSFDSGTESTTVEEALSQVEIGNIPDREGQYLRNALIDRFYRHGRPKNPRYALTVTPIREVTKDLDITKTSDATRAQLSLRTAMRLQDKQTGEMVLTRTLNATSSYNILNSEFATRVSEQNTRENALDDLARQIEMQIGLYLKR